MSVNERLAMLEVEMKEARKDHKRANDKIDNMEADLKILIEAHQKYKGFWGAITLIGASITTALGLWIAYFHK